MDYQKIFPNSVLAAIEIAFGAISLQPEELQDEAVALLVQKLKKKADTNHFLNGSKLIADIQEHLNIQQSECVYLVIKRPEVRNVLHG